MHAYEEMQMFLTDRLPIVVGVLKN